MVEGTSLENWRALTGTEGSNPSLSARREKSTFMVGFCLLLEEDRIRTRAEGSEFCQIFDLYRI